MWFKDIRNILNFNENKNYFLLDVSRINSALCFNFRDFFNCAENSISKAYLFPDIGPTLASNFFRFFRAFFKHVFQITRLVDKFVISVIDLLEMVDYCLGHDELVSVKYTSIDLFMFWKTRKSGKSRDSSWRISAANMYEAYVPNECLASKIQSIGIADSTENNTNQKPIVSKLILV